MYASRMYGRSFVRSFMRLSRHVRLCTANKRLDSLEEPICIHRPMNVDKVHSPVNVQSRYVKES